MPLIPIIHTENINGGYNSQSLSPLMNTHVNDERYIREERDNENARRNFVQGAEMAVGFGGEMAHQFQILAEKRQLAKDKVDQADYLNGLQKVTGEYFASLNENPDYKTWNEGYNKVVEEYHQNYLDTYQPSEDAMRGIQLQAAKYKTDNDVRIMSMSSKADVKYNVDRANAIIEDKTRGATLETFDADYDFASKAYDTKKMYVPIPLEKEELDKKYIRESMKFSAYVKKISTGNMALISGLDFEKDPDLTENDKKKLMNQARYKENDLKNQIYDDAIGVIESGGDLENYFNTAGMLPTLDGKPIVTEKMKRNLTLIKKSYDKGVESSRHNKWLSEFNSDMIKADELDISKTEDYSKLMELKKRFQENGSWTQVNELNAMIARKMKVKDAKSKFSPPIYAELKSALNNLKSNYITETAKNGEKVIQEALYEPVLDESGNPKLDSEGHVVLSKTHSVENAWKIYEQLYDYAEQHKDKLKPNELTDYYHRLMFPYTKNFLESRVRVKNVGGWFSNKYVGEFKKAVEYDSTKEYQDGDVVMRNGKKYFRYNGKFMEMR